MGTERVVLGYVIVMKSWRKGGNGPIGSGRLDGTGKRCQLYKVAEDGGRELVVEITGPTSKEVLRRLRSTNRFIPPHVAVKHYGETHF